MLNASADGFSISVPGVEEVDGAAREVFDGAVRAYASDLLDEASRYEATHRSDTSAVIQYTSAHIASAEQVVRNRGFAPKSRAPSYYVIRALQWFLTAGGGVTGGLITSDPAWGYPCAVCFTAALLMTVHLEHADYKERQK